MAFQNLSEEIRRLSELLALSRRAAGTGHRPDKLGGYDATRSTHDLGEGWRSMLSHLIHIPPGQSIRRGFLLQRNAVSGTHSVAWW